MHPDLLQELNELHIQEIRRGAARNRFAHAHNSIRRLRRRTRPAAVTQSNRPRERLTHA
jgi:hypothetical protein